MNLQTTLNHFGKLGKPFFFCISYDLKSWEVTPLEHLDSNISFVINGEYRSDKQKLQMKIKPINFETYKKKFLKVQKEIKKGNTYLLNLTTKTKITSSHSLFDIYKNASAKYKLFYKDKFVSFSPETFIQIKENTIYTYPMKGTINANILDAKEKILADEKEKAEHIMIVDLLRNDLNRVAKNVKVNNFRYVEQIKAGEDDLLQVSSEISGFLENDWHTKIGDILIKLLPAGSISGTPKRKTLEIIEDIEKYKRDFFTGIWGVYDGKTLDSAVLIRFIEKNGKKLCYKSGGGITLDSRSIDEYNEMIDKVYIP